SALAHAASGSAPHCRAVPTRRSSDLGEVLKLTHARNISGVPVVDGGHLVGIVTGRDMRFETRLDDPVRNVMTKKDRLVTVREGADRKSTRLNSSHVKSSYAVSCLKTY